MDELIVVRSTLAPGADGAMPVALFERDPAHPGGEAWIADGQPHLVARTAAVLTRLREGVLVEAAFEQTAASVAVGAGSSERSARRRGAPRG